jgi:AAA domain, putative AbiEii toxin, Type IV TA system/AAA ATPase domain
LAQNQCADMGPLYARASLRVHDDLKPRPRGALKTLVLGVIVMKVERIQIEHFRSIESSSLDDLEGLSVLVGLNNSGKSNVAAALRLFRTAFIGGPTPQRSDLSAYGGRWFRTRLQVRLSDAEVEPLLVDVLNHYNLPPAASKIVTNSLGFLKQGFNLTATFEPSGTPGDTRVEMRTGFEDQSGEPLSNVLLNLTRRFAPEILVGGSPESTAKHMQDVITGVIGSFVARRVLSLSPTRKPVQTVGTNPIIDFEPDATNLGNAIFHHSGSDSPEFRRFQAWLSEIFPSIERVVASPSTTNTVTLGVRERGIPFPVPADATSSGLLEAVTILSRLAFAPEGSFITMEEPEVHFHQGALRRLVKRLVAESPTRQLLLITHSGEVLDEFQVGPYVWFAHRPSGKPTKFYRIEKVQYIPWLQSRLYEEAADAPGAGARPAPPGIPDD